MQRESWAVLTEEIELPESVRSQVAALKGSQQMVFVTRDSILAIIVYEGYTGVNGSVSVHLEVKPGCMRPGMVTMMLNYVFGYLKCRQIIAKAEGRRHDLHKHYKRFGGERKAVIEGYFPDDDLHIYSIHRDRCPPWRRLMRKRGHEQA